ncbi:hypothetical protein HDC92_001496 [Pedobacter sp. AK017]|uniref:hypothetical protein n=1 Tax=Pedobacter sp. AK017 TaxID=2723073 RepID=UPI001613B128|nr:hypothetical protein [Pedobacter sp. AK017]MBB5437822.1 hypothetical protein [Pedobacter sp. AK017]
MAKFDGKFFKGTVGPVVYKQYRGMQLVTAKSRLKKSGQTEKTKKAALAFGLTSSLAADMRKNLGNIITDFYDGTMIYRFKTDVQFAMHQAMDQETGSYHFTANSFERLNGFEFNSGSPVMNLFFVQPEQQISGNTLRLSLPEMNLPKDLRFPKNATACQLNIAIGMYDLSYGHKAICPVQSIEIPYSDEVLILPERQFNFTIMPGCLCITLFSFQFIQQTFSGKQIINSKAFNPVAIFRAVLADGTVPEEQTRHWQRMKFSLPHH